MTNDVKTGADLFEMLADSPAGASLKFTALEDDYTLVWRWESKVRKFGIYDKPMDLAGLRELLAEMAEENVAHRIQLWVEIPHTVFENRSGEGSLENEVNARYLIDNFGSFDRRGFWLPKSEIRPFDTQFSRSLYVPIFDGRNGIGLDMPVSEPLVSAIDTLIECGYIDDSDTRIVIEQEIIDRCWDSFVRSAVMDKLEGAAEIRWLGLTLEEENLVLGEALQRMTADDSPRFEGDSWSVDVGELADMIMLVLSEKAAENQ
jgi:hypothetical protein